MKNSDIETFALENKMRTIIHELLAPTVRRASEVGEIIEKLQKLNNIQEERLSSVKKSCKYFFIDALYILLNTWYLKLPQECPCLTSFIRAY